MAKVVALVQARMSSSRFPGKVLEPLGGMPMIAFMIERVRRARTLDEIVVVTSEDATDDPLAEALAARGIEVFRGDLDDVLKRYAGAAEAYDASVVVRLTGDCPLVDPTLVDEVVTTLLESGADYASNIDPPTYADGLDVEAFTRAALTRAHETASDQPAREHVTLWMRRDEAGFARVNVPALLDSASLRLTVDYPDDLEVVREIVASPDMSSPDFDRYDIFRYLEKNTGLLDRNRHVRNEALAQVDGAVG